MEKIEEGRAFIAAAKKAKDAGEKEFEFDGKTYPVTIKDQKVEEYYIPTFFEHVNEIASKKKNIVKPKTNRIDKEYDKFNDAMKKLLTAIEQEAPSYEQQFKQRWQDIDNIIDKIDDGMNEG
jgi:pyruvate/2-oxoacid:ferredoxin oxidoreductase beta subunit